LFQRPISAALLTLAAIYLALPLLAWARRRRRVVVPARI
jgi:hypothetical protein